MKSGLKSIATSIAAFFMLVSVSASAQNDWVDATHLFEEEVRSVIDTVSRDPEPMFLMRNRAAAPEIRSFAIGDTQTFWTKNIVENKFEETRAVLKAIGKNCYVFLEEGKTLAPEAIEKVRKNFDEVIYPTNTTNFGSEWKPGIDGDDRIYLLMFDIKDGYNGTGGFVGGYFYAIDAYQQEKLPVHLKSNEREMLYLDINPSDPASDRFQNTIAHEFQHMIHFNQDSSEYTWVNEACSQIAPYLCGFGHANQVVSFMRTPDNSLTAWSKQQMLANYGQVYFWAQYISTRIASTDERRRAFIRRMVSQKSQGLSGLNAAIDKQGIKNNVRNLFRSFCVANYLNDDRIARGAYSYEKSLSRFALKPEIKVDGAPYEGKGHVKCWSAKAIQINPSAFSGADARFAFAGQKISAAGYANAFDVAVVAYSADGQAEPAVTWLNIKDYKAMDVIRISEKHNRLMMVVVNRGPEAMKAEQAFSKNAAPAAFSFRVSKVGAAASAAPRVASRSTGNSSNGTARRTDRSRARSILEEIVSSVNIEESAGIILGENDENKKSAAEIEYDFAFQKIAKGEAELFDAIKEALTAGEAELVVDFAVYYNGQTDEGKMKLQIIKNRIRDMLKFEEMQGNAKAAELLTLIER